MKVAAVISVILAIVTSVLAWIPLGGARTASLEGANSELLTIGASNIAPDRVASLRVVTWDADNKAARVFEVAKKSNAWVIPSHFNYPADGGGRVGETAGGVLNVKRGPLVTAKKEQHAELGVVDPIQESAGADDARGKRITLKDEGGTLLVDLIVGKPADTQGLRYVREAGKDEVYTAKLNVDISTAFKDWVETDLLKIQRAAIGQLSVKDYSINTQQGTLDNRSTTTLNKPPAATAWTSAQTPKGEKVQQTTVETLLTELTNLRLAGVRPFDPNWLQTRGFYLLRKPDGTVEPVGNEGSLEIGTNDGLRYHLIFGAIAVGDEQDTSATPGIPASQPTTAPGASRNRYMVVTVEYDPSLDAALAASATQPTTGSTTQPSESASAKPTTQQLAAGKKREEEKMSRFGSFFYVVSDESFAKLRPPTSKLFESAIMAKDKLPGDKLAESQELSLQASGMQIVDLAPGEGPAAADGDTLRVQYTGYLASDGKKFDSSRDRNEPFPVTLGQPGIIAGWQEGLKGMKAGGKRKLVIPPDLAYGPSGHGTDIPANATLVFDVEVVNLKTAGETPATQAATTQPATAPTTQPASSEAPANGPASTSAATTPQSETSPPAK